MTKLFAKLRSLLLVFWAKPKAPEPQVSPEKAAPERRAREHEGTMYYLGDLLDRLGEYFYYLRKLRKYDTETFTFLSQTGAQIGNGDMLLQYGDLPPLWKDVNERPAQGAIFWPVDEDENFVGIRLSYFTKLKNAPGVQAGFPGGIYRMACFHADKRHDLDGIYLVFHVAVDGDGRAHLLKEFREVSQKMPRSKRRSHKGYSRHVVRREWAYPNGIVQWVRSMKEEAQESGAPEPEYSTPEKLAHFLFTLTANCYHHSRLGAQVRVRSCDTVGTFSIDLLRTPYFFKDRDKTVNKNGRTRKIFHIVRTHKRKGKVVRTHFRGLRKFTWNGYGVTISVPGYHHPDWKSFSVAAEEVEDTEPTPKGMVELGKVGAAMSKDMERDDPWWEERKNRHDWDT